jgi:hypothetical protein
MDGGKEGNENKEKQTKILVEKSCSSMRWPTPISRLSLSISSKNISTCLAISGTKYVVATNYLKISVVKMGGERNQ